MGLNLEVDGKSYQIFAADTQAARSFARHLPIRLIFEDFGSNKRIAFVPFKLKCDTNSLISKAHAGDIAYYVPWGCLTVFRKTTVLTNFYLLIGRLNSDSLATFNQSESKPVKITGSQMDNWEFGRDWRGHLESNQDTSVQSRVH